MLTFYTHRMLQQYFSFQARIFDAFIQQAS
jgi:hypothetical protein